MKIRPTLRRGMLVAGVLAALAVATAQARTWTDNNGRRIEAEFVRVLGDRVVLDWNGKPMQVPINSLSEEDQEYLRGRLQPKGKVDSAEPADETATPDEPQPEPAKPAVEPFTGNADAGPDPFDSGKSRSSTGNFPRQWKDAKGREIVAKFVEVDGDKIVLDRSGKNVKVPFEKLSAVDQRFVHRLLKSRGLPDTLPGAKAADVETSVAKAEPAGKTREPWDDEPAKPSKKNKRGLDAEGEPDGKVQPLIARAWTDVDGKKITARFSTLKGTTVVLLFRNKPMDVPFHRLSDDDQTYVRDRLTERGETALLAGVDPRFAPPPQVAVAAPPPVQFAPPAASVFPPRFQGGGGTDQILADMRRREEERRQEWARRDAEAQQRRQESQRQEQEWAAQRQREQEERMRQMASASPPPMPSIGLSPSTTQVEGYFCSKCNHFMLSPPSNNKCPGCGVTIGYITERDGTRRETGAAPFVFGIPMGDGHYLVPGPRMIVGIIVLVFGGVAAFFRKSS